METLLKGNKGMVMYLVYWGRYPILVMTHQNKCAVLLMPFEVSHLASDVSMHNYYNMSSEMIDTDVPVSTSMAMDYSLPPPRASLHGCCGVLS